MPNLDAMCQAMLERSPNLSIPWFLMASYLYYKRDTSILSDPYFDHMALIMLQNWDLLKHRHKHLITIQDLRAGTLYGLTDDEYPAYTKGAAMALVEELRKAR